MKDTIKWIVGIILLLAGIGAYLSGSALSGVIYFFTGLFIIPPTLLTFEKSINTKIPSPIKYIIVISALVAGGAVNKRIKSDTVVSSNRNNESEVGTKATMTGMHEVLHTTYFDVTVNSSQLEDRVNTGNHFSNLKSEPGINYLILDVTFKNTDNESRMISDGSVFIDYNGKEYEYDKAETILADGWSIILDQINPLTSKRTKIVYKVPDEISGPAYYQPGRNSESERIYLESLK